MLIQITTDGSLKWATIPFVCSLEQEMHVDKLSK
jgi:hypothetical protein